ncbi:SHOCT domain-containing protein [Dictyobacter vulcani]|nr:SHOCT domain-containing protein [Dictyobacter vulcani]
MMWGYGYGYSWPMMLGMIFWNVLWLALLALAVWALIRWLSRSTRFISTKAEPSALEILRQRYARGEIDASTFEQMRERLDNPVPQ